MNPGIFFIVKILQYLRLFVDYINIFPKDRNPTFTTHLSFQLVLEDNLF